MADREKVIKAIETHISTCDSVGCDDCTYENDGLCMTRVLTDALALLKEQETVVHCRECKWYGRCELNDYMLNHENGFCADGEAKT